MARYSIRDLEKLSGIKAHTIRIWEKRYGIVEPQRTDTNIRYYSDKDLKKILNISILNKSGIKVSEIAKLSPDHIRDKIVHLTNNPQNVDSHIEGLVLSMIDLDEGKFEKLLSRFILQHGFRRTVMQVIFPFLDKIGILWQLGSISPAHEHFVSNIIRRKFIVAIDSQSQTEGSPNKTFVLFCHEKEMHELTLLFYNYVLRRKGFRVIYLGQAVPLEDVLQIMKVKPFDYILTSFITQLSNNEFSNILNKLKEYFPDTKILLTGKPVIERESDISDNMQVIKSSDDIDTFIKDENLI